MRRDHRQDVDAYFSRTARFWKGIYDERWIRNKFICSWMNDRAALVLGRLEEMSQGRALSVLDVGSGQGILLEQMARCGHDAFGVDINPIMVKSTRDMARDKAVGKLACIVSDCEALSLRTRRFDFVSCVGVLQYLERDETCLGELGRVTRCGGTVVITVPSIHPLHNLFDPYYLFHRLPRFLASKLRSRGCPRPPSDPAAEFSLNVAFLNRHYYWRQLRPLFERHGFIEAGTDAVAFSPLTFWGKPLFPDATSCRFSAGLRRLSRKPGFHWLSVLADRWVIALTKAGPGCAAQGKCL